MVSLGDVGYVAIFRQIFNHWLWQEKPFSKGQAWIDLLLLANHSDHKKPKGDKIITYRRGDVNRSVLFLADRWGWDRKTVKRFLRVLEADNMIVVKGTTQGTTITIVNYDFWQKSGSTIGTTHGTAYGTTHGSTHGTQTIMNKNDKEGEEWCVSTPTQSPTPSLEEVKAYCRERGFAHVNAEKFWNLYESRNWLDNGQPFKWKQRLAYWEAKDMTDESKSTGKKKAALDDDFWAEMKEKARKEDEARAKAKRDGSD